LEQRFGVAGGQAAGCVLPHFLFGSSNNSVFTSAGLAVQFTGGDRKTSLHSATGFPTGTNGTFDDPVVAPRWDIWADKHQWNMVGDGVGEDFGPFCNQGVGVTG